MSFEVATELQYAPGGSGRDENPVLVPCKWRTLNIYSPKATEKNEEEDNGLTAPLRQRGSKPVIVFCHGGGWVRGRKDHAFRGGPEFVKWACSQGYVTALIGYRLATPTWTTVCVWSLVASLICTTVASFIPVLHHLSLSILFFIHFPFLFVCFNVGITLARPGVKHPQQLHDICDAVQWVQRHVQSLCPDADPSRLFLAGHSAGGHLVSLAGTNTAYFEECGFDVMAHVKGVISISGIYSLHSPLSDKLCSFRNAMFRAFYVWSAFGYDKAVWEDASPIHHIAPNKGLPFLILSASSDLGLEVDARRFVAALEAANRDVEYHTIDGTSHASIAYGFTKHDGGEYISRFVSRLG